MLRLQITICIPSAFMLHLGKSLDNAKEYNYNFKALRDASYNCKIIKVRLSRFKTTNGGKKKKEGGRD